MERFSANCVVMVAVMALAIGCKQDFSHSNNNKAVNAMGGAGSGGASTSAGGQGTITGTATTTTKTTAAARRVLRAQRSLLSQGSAATDPVGSVSAFQLGVDGAPGATPLATTDLTDLNDDGTFEYTMPGVPTTVPNILVQVTITAPATTLNLVVPKVTAGKPTPAQNADPLRTNQAAVFLQQVKDPARKPEDIDFGAIEELMADATKYGGEIFDADDASVVEGLSDVFVKRHDAQDEFLKAQGLSEQEIAFFRELKRGLHAEHLERLDKGMTEKKSRQILDEAMKTLTQSFFAALNDAVFATLDRALDSAFEEGLTAVATNNAAFANSAAFKGAERGNFVNKVLEEIDETLDALDLVLKLDDEDDDNDLKFDMDGDGADDYARFVSGLDRAITNLENAADLIRAQVEFKPGSDLFRMLQKAITTAIDAIFAAHIAQGQSATTFETLGDDATGIPGTAVFQDFLARGRSNAPPVSGEAFGFLDTTVTSSAPVPRQGKAPIYFGEFHDMMAAALEVQEASRFLLDAQADAATRAEVKDALIVLMMTFFLHDVDAHKQSIIDKDRDGVPAGPDGDPDDNDPTVPGFDDFKDTDKGGVPDFIEREKGMDMYDAADDAQSSHLDSDNDGHPDRVEIFFLGASDGVPTGFINFEQDRRGADPTQLDANGLVIVTNTPNGLPDFFEDFDDDGVPNDIEVLEGESATDYLNPAVKPDFHVGGGPVSVGGWPFPPAPLVRKDGAALDSDNDKLSDLLETFLVGDLTTLNTPADVVFPKHDPFIKDANGNGRPDIDEDPDNDGIITFDEIFMFGTSPTAANQATEFQHGPSVDDVFRLDADNDFAPDVIEEILLGRPDVSTATPAVLKDDGSLPGSTANNRQADAFDKYKMKPDSFSEGDPLKPDFHEDLDKDGFISIVEIMLGSDPRDADSQPRIVDASHSARLASYESPEAQAAALTKALSDVIAKLRFFFSQFQGPQVVQGGTSTGGTAGDPGFGGEPAFFAEGEYTVDASAGAITYTVKFSNEFDEWGLKAGASDTATFAIDTAKNPDRLTQVFTWKDRAGNTVGQETEVYERIDGPENQNLVQGGWLLVSYSRPVKDPVTNVVSTVTDSDTNEDGSENESFEAEFLFLRPKLTFDPTDPAAEPTVDATRGHFVIEEPRDADFFKEDHFGGDYKATATSIVFSFDATQENLYTRDNFALLGGSSTLTAQYRVRRPVKLDPATWKPVLDANGQEVQDENGPLMLVLDYTIKTGDVNSDMRAHFINSEGATTIPADADGVIDLLTGFDWDLEFFGPKPMQSTFEATLTDKDRDGFLSDIDPNDNDASVIPTAFQAPPATTDPNLPPPEITEEGLHQEFSFFVPPYTGYTTQTMLDSGPRFTSPTMTGEPMTGTLDPNQPPPTTTEPELFAMDTKGDGWLDTAFTPVAADGLGTVYQITFGPGAVAPEGSTFRAVDRSAPISGQASEARFDGVVPILDAEKQAHLPLLVLQTAGSNQSARLDMDKNGVISDNEPRVVAFEGADPHSGQMRTEWHFDADLGRPGPEFFAYDSNLDGLLDGVFFAPPPPPPPFSPAPPDAVTGTSYPGGTIALSQFEPDTGIATWTFPQFMGGVLSTGGEGWFFVDVGGDLANDWQAFDGNLDGVLEQVHPTNYATQPDRPAGGFRPIPTNVAAGSLPGINKTDNTVYALDSDKDGTFDKPYRPVDHNGDNVAEKFVWDLNGDGKDDFQAVDSDLDGVLDTHVPIVEFFGPPPAQIRAPSNLEFALLSPDGPPTILTLGTSTVKVGDRIEVTGADIENIVAAELNGWPTHFEYDATKKSGVFTIPPINPNDIGDKPAELVLSTFQPGISAWIQEAFFVEASALLQPTEPISGGGETGATENFGPPPAFFPFAHRLEFEPASGTAGSGIWRGVIR